MVNKYIILADSNNTQRFKTPRQLIKINGEPLVARTIRLLKENGVKDILITSHDKRFDNLGAKRYEPKNNIYNPMTLEGYWLNGFPEELLKEPICFLFGDVYYSESAIKKIVNTDTDKTLFFCTYNNDSEYYIKHHDEPLGYKVADYKFFKKKIKEVKKLKDEGVCCREPVVWELYRVINDQYVNEHKMTKNYIAINDISCDIDSIYDNVLLNEKLGVKYMIRVEANQDFTLNDFDRIEKTLKRNNVNLDKKGFIYKGDSFECDKQLYDYLNGGNVKGFKVVDIIEVIPKKKASK